MKKIGILITAILMITTVNVSAAKMDINQDNCIVSVGIDIEREEKGVAILLRGKDEDGNIIYLDDNYTGQDGKYSCMFDASEAEGVLTVTANVVGDGIVEKTLIVRTHTVENELKEVISKENATKEEIKTTVEKYWTGLEIESELFDTLSDKDSVYEFLANDPQRKNINDYSGVKEAFYTAVIIQKYHELQNKNDICAYLTNTPYSQVVGEIYSSSYGLLSNKVKDKVAIDMKTGYTDSKEFLDDIEFSLLKNNIRYSGLWTEIQPVLANYAGKVGINRSITMDDCKKVIQKEYTSYQGILLELTYTPPVSNGSSSSGGGTHSVVITPTNPAVKEVTDEKTGISIFADMENHKWAEPYVQHVYELGIVAGYDDGNFYPAKNVTREEAVKMLISLMKEDISRPLDTLPFEDVSKDRWSYPYISTAFENEIVSGMSGNYFGAGLNVSRQEMAIMAWKVMNKLGIPEKGRLVFNDSDEIASWAKDAVEILGGSDIIHGRTAESGFYFDPKAAVTRAEAALIISNMAKLMP